MEPQNRKYTCFKCKDSGWIVAISKSNGGHYTFLCNNCNLSQAKSKSIPVWNDKLVEKYSVEFEAVISPANVAPAEPIKKQYIPKIDHAMRQANDDINKPEPIKEPFDEGDLPW